MAQTFLAVIPARSDEWSVTVDLSDLVTGPCRSSDTEFILKGQLGNCLISLKLAELITIEPDSKYHASTQQVKSALDFGEGSGAWLRVTNSNTRSG